MSIVLIGIPGAGKSTVGAALARHLGTTFMDIDADIEQRIGKPIADIFTEDGEAAFRLLEAQHIATVLSNDTCGVVALGGGALGNESTRNTVANHRTVWLQADLPTAVARVGLNRNRPLLLGNVRGQLASLMERRIPVYEAAADVVVDTSGLSVDDVVARVAQALQEQP